MHESLEAVHGYILLKVLELGVGGLSVTSLFLTTLGGGGQEFT